MGQEDYYESLGDDPYQAVVEREELQRELQRVSSPPVVKPKDDPIVGFLDRVINALFS